MRSLRNGRLRGSKRSNRRADGLCEASDQKRCKDHYGHPLGATGAMLVGTVVDELERTGKQTALVTLCIGAGMGTATIIERV